jgi:hypothetical protein
MTEVEGVGRRRMQLLDDLRKQKKILGAKRGSWRSKKEETTVYHIKIKKKYKLSSTHPWTC